MVFVHACKPEVDAWLSRQDGRRAERAWPHNVIRIMASAGKSFSRSNRLVHAQQYRQVFEHNFRIRDEYITLLNLTYNANISDAVKMYSYLSPDADYIFNWLNSYHKPFMSRMPLRVLLNSCVQSLCSQFQSPVFWSEKNSYRTLTFTPELPVHDSIVLSFNAQSTTF